MAIYTFEIPDEVAAWIDSVKNIQPQTYIQNQLVDPIIKEYESEVRKTKIEIAETQTTAEVDAIKKKMKVKEQNKVK